MNDTIPSLARLSFAMGEEERVTLHPDGRRESVATHSNMLLMVACTVATEANRSRPYTPQDTWVVNPELREFDVGLVAQFAAVHDIPEVAPGGIGDVDTFNITDPEHLALKAEAEATAVRLLERDHPTWLGPLIVRYEAQVEPEARLVRYLDKVMPKATLALSGCAQFKRDGTSAEYFETFVAKQRAELDAQYPELADLCGAIYETMNEAVRTVWRDQ